MKKALTSLSLLTATAFSAAPAYAQAVIQADVEPTKGVADLGKLFSGVADMAIIIAAIMVFFYLLWGGISWLTSGGDKAKTEEAQKRITAAVIGLAIVASAWAIIKVIDTFFGVGIFSGTGVNIPTVGR